MTINEKIEEALKDIKLPKNYLKRKKDETECIVYNYIENPLGYGDMKEFSTKYTVLINLYTKGNVEKNRKLVKKAMLDSGFKKIVIPSPVCTNGVYNTAMQFKIGLINKEDDD